MYQKGVSFIKEAISSPEDLDQILKKSLNTENKYYKSLIIFSILIIFYLIFGIVLLYSYTSVNEKRFRYDNLCSNLTIDCNVSFFIEGNMEGPIYFFYELKNFYQNHRKYMKSFNYDQFQGKFVENAGDCWPSITNKEMDKNVSLKGSLLNESDVAFPCGLIAKTFFNDTFMIIKKDAEIISIRETEIVPDLKDHVKKPSDPNYDEKAWIDIKNEHFLIWMKVSVYPKFRKLWGMIDKNIKEGEFILRIQNNYPVSSFNGEKYVVITTKGILGFKNLRLVVGYFVAAFICMILASSFFYLHRKNKKKKDL